LKRRAILSRRPDVQVIIQAMLRINDAFTHLERAVLAAICEVHPDDQTALEAQLSTATVSSRENNGHGFYTRFSVNHGLSAPVRGPQLKDGPVAKIDGLEHGMGFILWLKEGYACCLEGFGYGENIGTLNLETIRFEVDPRPIVNRRPSSPNPTEKN
jgi:hypothetical protein